MSAQGNRIRREMLDYLDTFQVEFGYPASLRDLARHFGKSKTDIHRHAEILRDAGDLIWQPGRSRTLRRVRAK